MSTRITLTLDDDLAVALKVIALKLKISKSSLVNGMLEKSVIPLAGVLNEMPDAPKRADFIRARGKSIEVVRERLDEFNTLADRKEFKQG